mmetsp:Transcript_114909/g.329960  ORF Transcript_114909/g.329960 Transcript_114909/m.329960 type:complete len:635 (+) Transcript_114909:799-2703(+)
MVRLVLDLVLVQVVLGFLNAGVPIPLFQLEFLYSFLREESRTFRVRQLRQHSENAEDIPPLAGELEHAEAHLHNDLARLVLDVEEPLEEGAVVRLDVAVADLAFVAEAVDLEVDPAEAQLRPIADIEDAPVRDHYGVLNGVEEPLEDYVRGREEDDAERHGQADDGAGRGGQGVIDLLLRHHREPFEDLGHNEDQHKQKAPECRGHRERAPAEGRHLAPGGEDALRVLVLFVALLIDVGDAHASDRHIDLVLRQSALDSPREPGGSDELLPVLGDRVFDEIADAGLVSNVVAGFVERRLLVACLVAAVPEHVAEQPPVGALVRVHHHRLVTRALGLRISVRVHERSVEDGVEEAVGRGQDEVETGRRVRGNAAGAGLLDLDLEVVGGGGDLHGIRGGHKGEQQGPHVPEDLEDDREILERALQLDSRRQDGEPATHATWWRLVAIVGASCPRLRGVFVLPLDGATELVRVAVLLGPASARRHAAIRPAVVVLDGRVAAELADADHLGESGGALVPRQPCVQHRHTAQEDRDLRRQHGLLPGRELRRVFDSRASAPCGGQALGRQDPHGAAGVARRPAEDIQRRLQGELAKVDAHANLAPSSPAHHYELRGARVRGVVRLPVAVAVVTGALAPNP